MTRWVPSDPDGGDVNTNLTRRWRRGGDLPHTRLNRLGLYLFLN